MAVIHAAAALTVAGVLLAGCSTPSATETVDAPAATTASAECADFTNALDRTVTQFAYLKVAVGSDLDETERLGTLQEYIVTMADGAA